MDELKRMEIIAQASIHLEQCRDLMNAALPQGWIMSEVGFENVETRDGFLARFVQSQDALDTAAILEALIELTLQNGGKNNAIH